jgi:hypothetical protein
MAKQVNKRPKMSLLLPSHETTTTQATTPDAGRYTDTHLLGIHFAFRLVCLVKNTFISVYALM